MTELSIPTEGEIAKLISFLPQLYTEGYKPLIEWRGGKGNDYESHSFPSPEYHPIVREFTNEASKECWCDFQYVQNIIEIKAVLENVEITKSFSFSQIKTFLTYCIRGERFCDGHWAAMIERGYIRAILERLQDLYEANEIFIDP
jgi:hypothetical protein